MLVGVIGPGIQAGRIVKQTIQSGLDCRFLVYLHREGLQFDSIGCREISTTRRLDALLDCDAIIVASPNETHTDYIRFFYEHSYKGYVLCEKPPAQVSGDIDYLERLDDRFKGRMYFHFNYRKSLYFEGLKQDGQRYDLGKIIHIAVLTGHGLGLKPHYKNSWRSDARRHSGGIFETVSIHFLDMLLLLFGMPSKMTMYPSAHSPYGTAMDNSLFACQFENRVTFSIAASYTTPFISNMTVLYENGMVTYDREKQVFSPRETYDDRGLFITPPLIKRVSIDRRIIAENSLASSVDYFFTTVKECKTFPLMEYFASLATNRVIIDAFNLRSGSTEILLKPS